MNSINLKSIVSDITHTKDDEQDDQTESDYYIDGQADEDPENDFDEKDELAEENTLKYNPANYDRDLSFDSSFKEHDNEELDSNSTTSRIYSTNDNFTKAENSTGKSKFYFPTDAKLPLSTNNQQIIDDSDFDLLSRLYYEEKFIFDLKNVSCLYSSSQSHCMAPNSKEMKTNNTYLDGRLILTTFRLMFIPYQENINANKLFKPEKRLHLFNHKLPFTIVVPLTSIFELRACKQSIKKIKI